MGIHQPQNELFNYQVNLGKRVRADHPLRRIKAILDLSFVRPAVEPLHGKSGHVGDPEILVKMMLLLFLDNVASERELVAIIRERLDYLWFLGYGLDDEVPNHSVLSKARARWGSEVFCQLFVRTVQQCVAAGLVDGRKLHIDSSLIRADASRDSVMEASPELVAAIRQAYAMEEQKLDEPPETGINTTHSAQNYRYCQSQGIRSHLGQCQAHTKGKFPVGAFVYEPEPDRYRCRAGHPLYYHSFKKEDQYIVYKIADPALCAGCALRAQCTQSESGRSVKRPIFSELVELGQEQARSAAAMKDRVRRKHLMEGSFADARNNQGFKRARWRGLWRQQIQDWLIAAVQNLRILMRRSGKQAAGAVASAISELKTAFAPLMFLLLLLSTVLGKMLQPCRLTKNLCLSVPLIPQNTLWATRPNVGGYTFSKNARGYR